jgi:L-cysteine S-thiosulfotransferase
MRLAAAACLLFGAAAAAQVAPYRIVDDTIPTPLTNERGDVVRGEAIVANRQVGLCTLCHQLAAVSTSQTSIDPKAADAATIATSLAGVGSRYSAAQLRLRIVDSRRLNPISIMPAYHRTDKLTRVGKAWQSQPIFSAQQVEDVVAYLVTLQ